MSEVDQKKELKYYDSVAEYYADKFGIKGEDHDGQKDKSEDMG